LKAMCLQPKTIMSVNGKSLGTVDFTYEPIDLSCGHGQPEIFNFRNTVLMSRRGKATISFTVEPEFSSQKQFAQFVMNKWWLFNKSEVSRL